MSYEMRFASVFANDGNWYKVENLRVSEYLLSFDQALASGVRQSDLRHISTSIVTRVFEDGEQDGRSKA